MKRSSGITMISLVLTVIIMLIISSIGVKIGTESYDIIKVQNYIAKMKVIQGKIDNIVQENSKNIEDRSNKLASENHINLDVAYYQVYDDVYKHTYGFTKLEDLENSSEDKKTFEKIIDKISNDTNMGNLSWSTDDTKENIGNYYYFTPEFLEKELGLKDQKLTVIVNFKTRNIISKTGVKLDGKVYYRQYDLPGADQLN